MQGATHDLLDPAEEGAPWPRRGQVDRTVGDGEPKTTGRALCGVHDEPLGEIHPVVDVGEGTVRLERGELRAVPRVDPLVAEVPGDLEDPLVAPDDQALEVELRGDPEGEVDVERVRTGEEGAGERSAGLRLEDGCLHFDELLGGEEAAQRGDDAEPDVEHPTGVRVGQEVDLTLTVPGVGFGQTMPLVGQGAQCLRQQVQPGDVQRELAPPARDHLPLRPDPVTEVDLVQDEGGPIGQGRLLHEQLQGPGHVLEGREREAPVTPEPGHPPGHAHRLAGPDVGAECVVALVELGRGGGAVEAGGIGIDPVSGQRIPLLATLGTQQVGRACRGLLRGSARRGLGIGRHNRSFSLNARGRPGSKGPHRHLTQLPAPVEDVGWRRRP